MAIPWPIRTATITLAAAVLAASAAARADTVLKGAPGTNPIAQPDVKVTGLANGELTYTTATGASRSAPLTDVQKITADDQPSFNAAEDAYANHNLSGALDGYLSAVNGTGPGWVKARSAQRLALVAKGQRRYDAAVAAYAALVGQDATLAAAARPPAPQPNDPRIDDALGIIVHAVDAAPAAQRAALLGVQMDIYRAKGDKAQVASTLQQLVNAGGASEADQAMLKLASAQVALDAKQYAQAEADVEASRQLFTDPAQQVEALWVLAQARDGQMKGTPDGMKDVALSYVRVATFGGQLPDRPHVAQALVRVGQLEEKLGDPKGALTEYQQVVADRAAAGSPAAAEAAKAIARLKK
jgi:hypothetical protein